MSQAALRETAEVSKAWPFEEARKLVARLETQPARTSVLFETGYGPSGLPHIGTFGEVARTTMVRHAFEVLTEGRIKTRLIAFSDDMDGLRKVPDNVPNQELLARPSRQAADRRCPTRSATHDSFGAHNNARLRAFLDRFGFDYEFASSTEYYKSGRFDAALLHDARALRRGAWRSCCRRLREERAATYSPFLPIHPQTGVVMQVPLDGHDAEAGTIVWRDPDDRRDVRDAGHRRPLQAAMEARLGDALVRARRRLRDGRQGPDRLGQAVRRRSCARSAARRPRASTTSCSSTRRARRSPSRRATA